MSSDAVGQGRVERARRRATRQGDTKAPARRDRGLGDRADARRGAFDQRRQVGGYDDVRGRRFAHRRSKLPW